MNTEENSSQPSPSYDLSDNIYSELWKFLIEGIHDHGFSDPGEIREYILKLVPALDSKSESHREILISYAIEFVCK